MQILFLVNMILCLGEAGLAQGQTFRIEIDTKKQMIYMMVLCRLCTRILPLVSEKISHLEPNRTNYFCLFLELVPNV